MFACGYMFYTSDNTHPHITARQQHLSSDRLEAILRSDTDGFPFTSFYGFKPITGILPCTIRNIPRTRNKVIFPSLPTIIMNYECKSLNNRNFIITFLQEYLQKLFVSYFSTQSPPLRNTLGPPVHKLADAL